MKREILEALREWIIERVANDFEAIQFGKSPNGYTPTQMMGLEALHALVCRELDRPECQHKIDDLVCGMEVAYGHLIRAVSGQGNVADCIDGAMTTLEALLGKERVP